MARKAARIELSKDEQVELESWTRKPTGQQRRAQRARIVLLAALGWENRDIAEKLGVSALKVGRWRRRFARMGLKGLQDRGRPGRPRVFGHEAVLKIVVTACNPPPGQTHWTVRDLAESLETELGISRSRLHEVLRELDLKPHQHQMWLNSRDPDFEAKQADVVGLYLNPPENALVICVDEKTGIQALGRKHPSKLMRPGSPEKVEFEYVRHGTQSLFAALLVHQGRVMAEARDGHTRFDFIAFLERLDEVCDPGKELHLVVDNLATHKHRDVRAWLAEHPRFHLHFTPTHASWLNQIEIWFSILSRKVIRRGVFSSKQEMVAKIMEFIERYNQTAKPFAWTYDGRPLRK